VLESERELVGLTAGSSPTTAPGARVAPQTAAPPGKPFIDAGRGFNVRREAPFETVGTGTTVASPGSRLRVVAQAQVLQPEVPAPVAPAVPTLEDLRPPFQAMNEAVVAFVAASRDRNLPVAFLLERRAHAQAALAAMHEALRDAPEGNDCTGAAVAAMRATLGTSQVLVELLEPAR
jgi:hypothetical protein